MSKERKGLLYHYTSPTGLIGLLQSSNLWLSHISSLNDEQEFQDGLSIINDVAGDYPQGDLSDLVNGPMREALSLFFQDVALHVPVYVACFSAKGNDLTQWRSYCPPSGGYSVGFAPELLHGLTRRREGLELLPCIYERDEKEREAKALLDRIATQKVENATLEIARFACRCKHQAFESESETRLVSLGVPPESAIQFSGAVGYVKPRLELEFDRSAIEVVRIGPTKEVERAKVGLQLLLQMYPAAAAIPSKIPYRA